MTEEAVRLLIDHVEGWPITDPVDGRIGPRDARGIATMVLSVLEHAGTIIEVRS